MIGSVSSPHALKRVAEWGDGWLPVISSVNEFADGVIRIKQMAKEAGRDPEGFDFSVFALERNGAPNQSFRHSRRPVPIESCSGYCARI